MIREIMDFVFPGISLISDERLSEENSNQYLKDYEIFSLTKVSYEDLAELNNKILADISFSYFSFREGDEFSKIIYQLKYGGMKKLGEFMGELLGDELLNYFGSENICDFDFIIPVPLYKTKLRERGYNQSESICNGLNKYIKGEINSDVVRRIRHTDTQTKLNREERMSNMENAFKVSEKFIGKIESKKIILVDDVVTTGSTLNEIIKVLRENKCGEVMAVTLAMAR